jgi:(E)-4-hydroxy-3-methylbut-2-enyl-diphosphate synthase
VLDIVRKPTIPVEIGKVTVGGSAPIAVQSMTNTDTSDVAATVQQILELAGAGSELVRITVNRSEAAAAVPEIVNRVRDAGCDAPIAGDFHFNGHRLLTDYPACATALDKYRINPGNVGVGAKRDVHFATICRIAADNKKPVRIGVNIGSLNPDLVERKMRENTENELGRSSDDVYGECLVASAIESVEMAMECGLRKNQIVISCKSSSPRQLISVYRDLSSKTDQPLHLGLTEAGMGSKGVVWSAVPMGILLNEGIGDTIRVSLTPRPNEDRRNEVFAACQILQSLELRTFVPIVTACPGCGRTSSKTFQVLAEDTQAYVNARMPEWKNRYMGVETLTLAVMGCIVNGPGESKHANVGISLPGTGEDPACPVYVDGRKVAALAGPAEKIEEDFFGIIEKYVGHRYPKRQETHRHAGIDSLLPNEAPHES